MPCCCDAECTTRNYSDAGTAQWQGPGVDKPASFRTDIAIDGSGNAYTTSGGVEKLDNTGVRDYLTANDGRFGHRRLNCICLDDDGTHGYVGSDHEAATAFTPGYTGDNVYKIDLSDGSVVDSDSVGAFSTIVDCCSDGNGGVYFAMSADGIAHFNSSFVRQADVGCVPTNGSIAAICVDTSDNLYVAGGECTHEESNGCSVTWTVRKYNSSGTLIGGINLPIPSAVAWYANVLYVGFKESDATACNIVALDDTTWECLWSFRVNESENPAPIVRDIAVTADHVYVVSRKWLFALNPATGAKDWCRKNEGERPDTTLKSGQLYAVAADADYVWVTGQATPCNDAEEDTCDSGTCTNDSCDCECGTSGRTGGSLVRGCGCDEVPCEFSTTITSDCGDLDGATIDWTRTSTTTWTGTLSGTCGSATFTVTMDCNSATNDGWSITATGIITSVTITDTFCTDTAPAGFSNPGFIGTFTVASGTCSTCEGCLAFGTDGASCPPATVDLCGCTGIPQTLTATITSATGGCSTGATATLTYDGSATWTGSFSCGIGATLSCSGGSTWVLALTDASCFLTASLNGSGSCSPFSFAFGGYTYLASGSCTCCSSNGSITITVTA